MTHFQQAEQHSRRRRAALFWIAAASALALSGCNDFIRTWHTPRGDADTAYKRLSTEGQGFAVGRADAPQTVYVLFDPQCGHCGTLWRNSQKLPTADHVKFVWLPVAAIRRNSILQGATILASSDPIKTMSEHEELLRAKKGGITATSAPDAQLRSVIDNTRIAQSLGIDQVPYLATRRADGSTVIASGDMTPQALAAFISVQSGAPTPSTPSSTPSSAGSGVN